MIRPFAQVSRGGMALFLSQINVFDAVRPYLMPGFAPLFFPLALSEAHSLP